MKKSFFYKPEVKTTRRDFMKNTAALSLGFAAFPEFSIAKSEKDKKEYDYIIIGEWKRLKY